jgi:hypothetical protein
MKGLKSTPTHDVINSPKTRHPRVKLDLAVRSSVLFDYTERLFGRKCVLGC